MIEPHSKWLESSTDVRKIQNPARIGIHIAGYMHCNAKGMSVQARTFVIRRYVWQAMCCLNLKYPKNFHICSGSCSQTCMSSIT